MNRRQTVCCSFLLVAATSAALGACGSSSQRTKADVSTSSPSATSTTVTMLTHDAFDVSEPILKAFTATTGIKVKLLKQSDAGIMVNQAILTKDRPQADVMYGVDNTFLSRALDEGIFSSRTYRSLDNIETEHLDRFRDALQFVVPIDYGDVCLNFDKAWFAKRSRTPPASLRDIARPEYRGLTVVENPATSSPGLAFLAATVSVYGDQWKTYWGDLKANDVRVVNDWSAAYETEFSAGGGSGKRPIVVSYASSPPADVVYSGGAKTEPSIGVVTDGCFRQYEFAGVLKNAAHADAGSKLVEFLASAEFQADMPLKMFVYPTRRDTNLPEVFAKYAAVAPNPVIVDYRKLGVSRSAWIREWTELEIG